MCAGGVVCVCVLGVGVGVGVGVYVCVCVVGAGLGVGVCFRVIREKAHSPEFILRKYNKSSQKHAVKQKASYCATLATQSIKQCGCVR